jgi:integrase
MLPALERELRAHRLRQAGVDLRLVNRHALVFTTATGKPQSRRNALRAVHAAGDAAGLNGDDVEPVGLHDLRHSLVAGALDSGVTLRRSSGARASREREGHGADLRGGQRAGQGADREQARRRRVRRVTPGVQTLVQIVVVGPDELGPPT